jgi:hypothetical protein
MIVISHLALNEMIKLKGEIVDICLLLESEDTKLTDLVRLFLSELKQKGNNIVYNLIPKALAKFTTEFKNIEYEKFQKVIKELISKIDKDKEVEGLINKLINKLKDNNDVVEWRNLTFCLSQLNYSEKNVSRVLENYSNIKNKVEDEIVNKNLLLIFERIKKNKTGDKEALDELQKLFSESLKLNGTTTNNDSKLKEALNNRLARKKGGVELGKKRGLKSKSSQIDEDSDNASSEFNPLSKAKVNIKTKETKLSQNYKGLAFRSSSKKKNDNQMNIDDEEFDI